MSLRPGTSLGHYEILALLGAGGMGEVYRARDTRLGRDVALKILPEAFVNDPDRLARFQREAKTLASLNHPHIAHVHGFEEIGTTRALVLELVAGEDLAQRLAHGAVPMEEALPIARQIAEAIEVAHEAGIIHRDLKPANITVRHDGQVKVLDFGLAKAMEPPGSAVADPALSPTLTSPATLQGTLLGTAAYMAPEQARGKSVDKRADIWAFGVVLYEMLTGTRAFPGANGTEVLAAVLRDTPDLTALPADTPPSVRHLLARCLERDPSRRLRDIGEARIALEERAGSPPVAAGTTRESSPRARGVERLALWSLVAVAAASVTLAAWAVRGRGNAALTSTLEVQRFDVAFPRDIEPSSTTEGGIALSPNGKIVAMTGWKRGVRTVFVRRLDSEDTREMPGLFLEASAFSPDNTRIAFFGNGVLQSYSLIDGEMRTLTSGVEVGGGLAWGETGLVFARERALWIVEGEGREARRLTTLDAGRREVAHSGPAILPGGRIVLFSTFTPELGGERIEAVPTMGGPRSVVLERATSPVWSPTGHLLFTRNGGVLAVPLDAATATVTGTATPVFPAGQIAAGHSGTTALRVARTGTLAYVPSDSLLRRLVSVARDGAALPLDLSPGNLQTPRLSPDRRRVLVTDSASVLAAWDLERRSREQLTTPSPGTRFGMWSRDGSQLMYRRFNVPTLARIDATEQPMPIPYATANDFPSGPGPGADTLLVSRVQPGSLSDVFLLSTIGAFEPKPIVVTSGQEGGPHLSPDQRWIVYATAYGGRTAVSVRRYASLGRQWQVSEGSGTQARWSANGREIYYRDGTSVMAVPFDGLGDEPVIGKAMPLFRDDYEYGPGISIANYDPTPDGRFLMLRRESQGGQLHIVQNWTEELKQIIARGGVR